MPWVALLIFIWVFFKPIKSILASLAWRMKIGASVKVGNVELGAIPAIPGDAITKVENEFGAFHSDGDRQKERDSYYANCHGVMLVHKIFKSATEGQLFDVQIYLVSHAKASLASIVQVEYFFGRMWGNKVFPAKNRFNGFAISTCAYGSFLCVAKIQFVDGSTFTQMRYIDFEMGATAPAILPDGIETTAP
jgi:hypothetical protein